MVLGPNELQRIGELVMNAAALRVVLGSTSIAAALSTTPETGQPLEDFVRDLFDSHRNPAAAAAVDDFVRQAGWDRRIVTDVDLDTDDG
jgi:hypothetical protein